MCVCVCASVCSIIVGGTGLFYKLLEGSCLGFENTIYKFHSARTMERRDVVPNRAGVSRFSYHFSSKKYPQRAHIEIHLEIPYGMIENHKMILAQIIRINFKIYPIFILFFWVKRVSTRIQLIAAYCI